MTKEFDSKLIIAKQMLAAQGCEGEWNHSDYMHGLYNGMEFIIAIMENREPEFRDAPKEYIDTKETMQ